MGSAKNTDTAVGPSVTGSMPFNAMADTRALPRHAREHNRSLVARVLYRGGPMSRADIARTTGLAKVTISDLVAQLMESGYVEELGMQEVTGPGKPAILVDLSRSSQLVLAVDVSEYHRFRAALLDMDANVVHRLDVPRDGMVGDDALNLLYSLVEQLIAVADKPIMGVGIGSPGIVNSEGTVQLAQNLHWRELPLQQLVAERFGLPVIVDNDANLAAMGELLHGEATDNFVLLAIGHGIGSGIILGGSLIRGTGDASGEIGVVVVGTEEGMELPYSAEHTLEHWLSLPALETHWEGKGPEQRKEILRSAGQRLGVVLANLVAALDLSEIVLTGPPEVANQELVDAATDIIKRRTLPGAHPGLRVRVSSKGEDLVFLGCSARALSEFLGVF